MRPVNIGGWGSGLKLMATHVQRAKKAAKSAAPQVSREACQDCL